MTNVFCQNSFLGNPFASYTWRALKVPAGVPSGGFGGGAGGLRLRRNVMWCEDPSEWISKIDVALEKHHKDYDPSCKPVDVFEASKRVEERKREDARTKQLEGLKRRIDKLQKDLERKNVALDTELDVLRKMRQMFRRLKRRLELERERRRKREEEYDLLEDENERYKKLAEALEKWMKDQALADLPPLPLPEKKPPGVLEIVGAGLGWYVGAAITGLATYFLVPDDSKDLKFIGYATSGILGFVGITRSIEASKR